MENNEQQPTEEVLKTYQVELDENEMELLARQVNAQIDFTHKVKFKAANSEGAESDETKEAIKYHEDFLSILNNIKTKLAAFGYPEPSSEKV